MAMKVNIRQVIYNTLSKVPSRKNKLLHKSEVFCMAPWIQLHAQTNGKVAPCCMSAVSDGCEFGDLRENPRMEDAWNSTNAKQLRLNMLKGEKSNICSHCYDYEKNGKFSERMTYNRDYGKVFSKVTATAPDGSLEGLDIPLIDIRFNNKCNYKCRICDSAFSTLWFDEEQLINRPRRPPTYDTEKEINAASDVETFMESYKRMLPGVKRLHFAGGEPLVMREHFETLQHLIAIGHTHLTLSYNTNFSMLRYKEFSIIELWNKFDSVDIWASLDGMGAQGDYHRKGQKWERIEDNIRMAQQKCTSMLFGVNITVSIFNILHVPNFYKHLVENKLAAPDRINLYLLFDPSYYSIVHLTPALKDKAQQQFEIFEKEYLSKFSSEKTSNIRNHIKSVINYMNGEQGHLQPEFKKWVHAVDEIRNEKFETIFPELQEMMR